MGYEVWADVMRLHGGIDWARELETALRKRSFKMLLVCTLSGLEKQGVRNEIEIGINLSRQIHDEAFIIPLRLETYDAPFRIAHAQYIDFKRSWAAGLSELVELLQEMNVPRGTVSPMQGWLETHANGADQLLQRTEPLVSNWLQIGRNPKRIHFVEYAVGSSLERFTRREMHSWPVVPHRNGVVSFATPDSEGNMAANLPGKLSASVDLSKFLDEGWPSLGIDRHQARRMYADLGSQAFDLYCKTLGLTGFQGSGKRVSWWGSLKTAPIGQVKFDWAYRRGSRQVIGQSGKRGIHWHLAMNAQVRTAPVAHIRLSPRLVFSENGMDAIDDVKRSHRLRRSFAKGWRNARWRDMLCAYLWWIADGKAEMHLPVGPSESISVSVPPMQFSCPVSVKEGNDVLLDEDDPDVPDDDWTEEASEEHQQ